jgi:hypothetical protein
VAPDRDRPQHLPGGSRKKPKWRARCDQPKPLFIPQGRVDRNNKRAGRNIRVGMRTRIEIPEELWGIDPNDRGLQGDLA